MKKLCFAVIMFFLFVGNAKADRHASFIKLECNQDFGLLEIGENTIYGSKIGDYFEQMKPFYKYSIDTVGEDKSHAEIILINNFTWNGDKPFEYVCKLGDKQIYKVEISWVAGALCSESQDTNYGVTITELPYEDNGKKRKILDNVLISCSGIQTIYLTARNEKGADITFNGYNFYAYFMNDEIIIPITNKQIEDENQRMKNDDELFDEEEKKEK